MTSPTFARGLAALLGLTTLVACTERQPAQELRSLAASEDVVFLCRDASGRGHPYSDCPDRDKSDDEQPERKLSVMALVTQALTDEVAVVNVTEGHVIDVDPSTPGYGFLRVGGRPVAIATTPGGTASFVATADIGRNGLFAIPTRRLAIPGSEEERLDLTTWNACRLPEAPGEIAVVSGGSGECASGEDGSSEAESDAAGAKLSEESAGRLKLIVSLPESGRLAVIDAQAILNRAAGTFDDCPFAEVKLAADVPAGVSQTLPPDLTAASSCTDVPAPMAPPASRGTPRPAGFAQSEGRLFIADAGAPVIHVLDTSDVCRVTELAPLLPMSLREPDRVVTTRRIAVSPLTAAGQQFVYAIDPEDQPHATVMAFDVSPGSTDRTPIVRSGSPELSAEKPDRLTFAAPARDVVFAYRDIPYVNPATGAAEFGVRCSPDPGASGPAALARPNSSYTVGARPGLLRGLFGFVLLTTGRVEIVDIDDLDADCRRPLEPNTSDVPDFRGCVGDVPGNGERNGSYVDMSGTALTTDETSCRVVEPHRPRSQRLLLNNSVVGVATPSLRTFPLLQLPAGEASTLPEDRPRLLAVPFARDGAELPTRVYVGSTRYVSAGNSGDPLPIDPNGNGSEDLASQNSLVLPPLEPRAYGGDIRSTLTFEGPLSEAEQRAGFLDAREGELTDPSLSFCAAGVYDLAAISDYARAELGLSAEDAEQFGETHGDLVQITDTFPAETDSYWQSARASRADCVQWFGEADAQTLKTSRDLDVVEAFAGRLRVRPAEGSVSLDQIDACFPTALRYRIRGKNQWVLLRNGQLRHDVVASGADSRCVRTCNPLFKWQKSRVFEVSSRTCREELSVAESSTEEARRLRVGCALPEDLACVYDQGDGAYRSLVGSGAERCIFDGLTERFAVYRGRVSSVRGSTFAWNTTGGFLPLGMTIANNTNNVAPRSIQYLPQSEQLAVVDGASQGLSLLSLDTFGVVKPSPFY